MSYQSCYSHWTSGHLLNQTCLKLKKKKKGNTRLFICEQFYGKTCLQFSIAKSRHIFSYHRAIFDVFKYQYLPPEAFLGNIVKIPPPKPPKLTRK